MKKYKVAFKDNVAQSATLLVDHTERPIKFVKMNEKRFIEWFVVSGYCENDAMRLASTAVTGMGQLFG